MVDLKAILFDLHGTVAYVEERVTENEISENLNARGYEVSPQTLRAAWAFVAFVDYPKHGYKDWRSYFSRVLWRLKVNVDQQTLDSVVKLFESKPYRLYSDAAEAIPKAKKCGFKTAIVTTIARFQFDEAIRPVKQYVDFVMTGYEARCDKSNPKMYLRVLEALDVDPPEAIMIGDDLELDILLPKRLGINTLMLNRNRDTKRQSVDAFVYDLNEAMETVIKQYGRS